MRQQLLISLTPEGLGSLLRDLQDWHIGRLASSEAASKESKWLFPSLLVQPQRALQSSAASPQCERRWGRFLLEGSGRQLEGSKFLSIR